MKDMKDMPKDMKMEEKKAMPMDSKKGAMPSCVKMMAEMDKK